MRVPVWFTVLLSPVGQNSVRPENANYHANLHGSAPRQFLTDFLPPREDLRSIGGECPKMGVGLSEIIHCDVIFLRCLDVVDALMRPGPSAIRYCPCRAVLAAVFRRSPRRMLCTSTYTFSNRGCTSALLRGDEVFCKKLHASSC